MALLTLPVFMGAQETAGVTVSQSVPLYVSGTSLDVSCAFAFPAGRRLESLLWVPVLPAGWHLLSAAGDGTPEVDPEGKAIAFLGADLSARNPLVFTYTVAVPEDETGAKTLNATVEYQLDGMANPELAVAPEAVLSDTDATHALAGYLPGDRETVTCSFAYPAGRQLQSLLWIPELPAGWELVEASGQGGPQVDPGFGAVAFFGADLPDYNPVVFTYTVRVPAGETGVKDLRGHVEFQLDRMANPSGVRVNPDPLAVPPKHMFGVVSAEGHCEPAVGIYTNLHGAVLSASVETPFTAGTRTFACTGWTLTEAGQTPVGGASTNVTWVLTNDLVLTWNWVAPLVEPAGSVNATMDEDNAPTAWVQPTFSASEPYRPELVDGLVWSLAAGPSNGAATVTGTGAAPTVTYTPNKDWFGGDSFVVQVADGLGGFDRLTVDVTVNPVNDAPVLNPIGDRRTDIFTPLAFTVSATDAESDALTYTLDAASLAAGMTLDPVTGAFAWTPAEGQAGTDYAEFRVTVTVTDNGTGPDNQTDSETFTVTLDSSRATHAAVGYVGGQPLTVTCAFDYPATTGRQLQSLLWRPELPAGWTLVDAAGDGAPVVDGFDGALVFLGGDLPAHNPVVFSYVVDVPENATGVHAIGGLVEYQLNGMANPAAVRAQPDPLTVPMLLTLPGLEVADKVYDGLTNAAVVTYGDLAGLMAGHEVSLVTAGAAAWFDTPQAGTDKRVVVGGLALAGADAAWYAIGTQVVSAAIAPKTLTVGGSFTALDKVYDGTAGAVFGVNELTLVTPVEGDEVALDAVAVFDGAEVGSGKTVGLSSGTELVGADAANYTLSLEGAPTATADILFPEVGAGQVCILHYKSPSLGLCTISNSFVCPVGETMASLTWTPFLPEGWTICSVTGDGSPTTDGTHIVFSSVSTASSPIAFTYTLTVPSGALGTNILNSIAVFGLASMGDAVLSIQAQPELLLKRYHSADYQTMITPINIIMVPDWKIDGQEAQTFLQHYRTGQGEYHTAEVTPQTPDGYMSGIGETPWYHSGDYQTFALPFPISEPDGKIDGLEAQRVLMFYRTGRGDYHIVTDPALMTPDGYAEGF
jgi:hypothetical protein